MRCLVIDRNLQRIVVAVAYAPVLEVRPNVGIGLPLDNLGDRPGRSIGCGVVETTDDEMVSLGTNVVR